MNKRLLYVGIFITGLSVLGYWLYDHAFIAIPGQQSGSFTYTIQREDGQAIRGESIKSVKKLVSRGNYSVTIEQNNASNFSTIRTSGFLSTTTVSGTLLSQNSRQFVGQNPRSCWNTVQQVLVSYQCFGGADTIVQHVPAAGRMPTYTKPIAKINSYDDLEGIISIGSNTYVIARKTYIDENTSVHSAQQITADTALPDVSFLQDIDPDTTYMAKAYQNGLLMIDQTYETLWHYKDLLAKPKKINIPTSPDAIAHTGIGINNQFITVFSSDPAGDIDGESENSKPIPGKSSAYITDGSSSRTITVPVYVQSATACGTKRLCVLSGRQFLIYDISSQQLRQTTSIPNINEIYAQGESVIAVSDDSVIRINPTTSTGYVAYSSRNYSLCGANITSDGLVICVANSKRDRSALLIEASKTNGFFIDDAVNTLQKDPLIKNVTAYKNTIFIDPQLDSSKQVYNPNTRSYDYPSNVTQEAKNNITRLIKATGIDTTKYSVVTLTL